MRVGLVSPYAFDLPGGVQNHILGLAGWLSASGHHVSVFGPGRLAPEALLRNGLAEANFVSAGAWVPVPFNGSVARISSGPTAAKVRRWLDDFAPEVVHVHEPITPSLALQALRLAPVPVVATFHAVTRSPSVTRVFGRLVASQVDRIERAIAVSGSAARRVEDALGLGAEVIPNGIRMADFAGASDLRDWRGGARPVVATLGRLGETRKGLPVLLRAARGISAAPQSPRLIAAGPGRPPLFRRGVEFPGALTWAERADLLRVTDVFLAPHTGRESFGLVLVEALAAGASVLASDLPEFQAVLAGAPPNVARTFPKGDAGALAAAVRANLERAHDPSEARGFAAAYDWSRVGPRISAVYDSVCGAPPRA